MWQVVTCSEGRSGVKVESREPGARHRPFQAEGAAGAKAQSGRPAWSECEQAAGVWRWRDHSAGKGSEAAGWRGSSRRADLLPRSENNSSLMPGLRPSQTCLQTSEGWSPWLPPSRRGLTHGCLMWALHSASCPHSCPWIKRSETWESASGPAEPFHQFRVKGKPVLFEDGSGFIFAGRGRRAVPRQPVTQRLLD